MRRVIVESPFAGNLIQRFANRRYARRCLHDCFRRGEAPYTQRGVLRDGVALEREQGIRAGLIWGERAQATVSISIAASVEAWIAVSRRPRGLAVPSNFAHSTVRARFTTPPVTVQVHEGGRGCAAGAQGGGR